jgi:hypothetical protein
VRIGAPAKRRSGETKLREARLRVARANQHWTEIPDDLVPRANGLLVSVSSDQVFKPHDGVVWERNSSAMIAESRASTHPPTQQRCRSHSPLLRSAL